MVDDALFQNFLYTEIWDIYNQVLEEQWILLMKYLDSFLLKLKDLHNILASITFSPNVSESTFRNVCLKPEFAPCLLKPLLAYFQWDCFRNCPWMSAVFFFPRLCLFAHSVCVLCLSVPQFFRRDQGDFFIGCLFLTELSTPFVSLGKILIQVRRHVHMCIHQTLGSHNLHLTC